MSEGARFPIHHVPDDGRWYPRGTIVRIVPMPQVDLIPDPSGDYEVDSCERDVGLGGGPPQLTVQLRKIGDT
jgi:hypothetical protein